MFERTAKEDGTNKAVNSKLLQTSKINKGVCKVGEMVKSVGKFVLKFTVFFSSYQIHIKKSTQGYSRLDRDFQSLQG